MFLARAPLRWMTLLLLVNPAESPRWLSAQTAQALAARPEPHAPFDHRYLVLERVLRSSVRAGGVNYPRVREVLPLLDSWLSELEHLSPQTIAGFSRDQQFAFYVNVYNARVLQLVAQNLSLTSIRELDGAFDRLTFLLAGKAYTLDHLEHQILRPKFKEARVHFVLNCAAISCPKLQPEPLTAERLEMQLEQATRAFMQDVNSNRVETGSNKVYFSKIFAWFGQDFEMQYSGKDPRVGLTQTQEALLRFYARYVSSPSERKLLLEGTPDIAFLEYDWRLNRAP